MFEAGAQGIAGEREHMLVGQGEVDAALYVAEHGGGGLAMQQIYAALTGKDALKNIALIILPIGAEIIAAVRETEPT